MKKILLLSIIIASLLSCSKDCDDCDNGQIVSRWALIGQLVDPGNGSGVYVPVYSDKIIEFYNDALISSNGSLCTMSITSDESSTGRIVAPDNMIIPDDCQGSELIEINYTIESDTLIIYYPCIESCSQKYIRLDN